MGPGTPRVIFFLLLVPALFAAVLPAQGQEDKKASREREALRRAQQALRQSEEQRAALQAENAALQDKLKAASAKADQLAAAELRLAAALKRAGRLDAELAKSRQANAELEKKLADAGARHAQLSQEHTEALRTIASRDAQLKLQQATLTQTRGEIGACEEKNLKLYGYGSELMRRYREKSAFEAIRQAEPLTGLQRAQIDNVLEEYRDKLQAQRVGH
jgi:predicted RNase H-like nuclease (RuvC/YqgF family)